MWVWFVLGTVWSLSFLSLIFFIFKVCRDRIVRRRARNFGRANTIIRGSFMEHLDDYPEFLEVYVEDGAPEFSEYHVEEEILDNESSSENVGALIDNVAALNSIGVSLS